MSFGDPWVYIVLLGAAALVYALLLPGLQTTANSNTDTARELEATLEQYMAEIEKENEELIGLVAQMKQDFVSKQLAGQEQIAELRQRLGEVELSVRQSDSRLLTLEALAQSESLHTPAEQAQLAEAAAALQPAEPENVSAEAGSQPETDEPQREYVRDRYPELFELYANGKSIDMIAKAVGLQRGEVQLILQLAKKEESR